MSLLSTFRSLQIVPSRPGILNRWLSALKFPRPYTSLSLRSPVLLPALAAVALVAAAGFQLTFPAISRLPPKSDLAPRRVREPAAPRAEEYLAVLKSPIFAPDRAPDRTELSFAGGMAGYAVLGTGIAGDVATALIRTPSGTIQRVRPGEELDGWKLMSVGQHELMLVKDNEQRILTVVPQPPVAAAPPEKPVTDDSADQSDDSNQTDTTNNDDNNGLSP